MKKQQTYEHCGAIQEMLENSITKALCLCYDRDRYLIECQPECPSRDQNVPKHWNHVSERGLVFKFGCYLQNQELLSRYMEEKGMSIDVEYNRHLQGRKSLGADAVIPDLIVHKRGSDNCNLFVAEFKTWWNLDVSGDKDKIQKFMSAPYSYKYGAVIVFEKERYGCRIIWGMPNGKFEEKTLLTFVGKNE